MSNICPSFVQHLSKICKCPSFVKFFTNKWTIVNSLSNICPYFVQFLQFVQMFKHQRKIGQSYCQIFVQVLSKNKFLLWLQNVSMICPKFVFDQGLSNLMSNDLGNHTNFCECPNLSNICLCPRFVQFAMTHLILEHPTHKPWRIKVFQMSFQEFWLVFLFF